MELKCLHIITRLANGGAEESVFDLIMQLSELGVYCDIAIGSECLPEVLAKYDIPKQCTIHRILHMGVNPHPINDLIALKEIRVLIKTNKYNIVQTHGSKAGVLGRIAAHKEKVKAIIGMIHGISFPNSLNVVTRTLYKFIERYTAKLSHAMVCVGEDIKQIYIDAGIGNADKYSVIYTGMKLDKSIIKQREDAVLKAKIKEEFGLPKSEHTVVLSAIGRLVDSKNQKALITMLPALLTKHSNIHLVFIGDGPNMDSMINYAQQIGVDSYISFTGYISDVWRILPAVDLHCMVSLREGLPRVLVQTAAAGIPNVCYKVEGVWEIIADEVSGFVVPFGNQQKFIDKLSVLISSKQKRKEFGMQAIKLADSRWNLKKYGDDTLALYTTLLS